MSRPIIEVCGVSKRYRLGEFSAGSLREELERAWSRFWKKNGYAEIGIAPMQSRSTKEFWALKDVSFSVQPGEVVGIIGRNGAGKSTLLKILSRITEPTSGEVIMRGRVASLLEVGTGFHPELSGRDNIYLNGSILGMTKAEITRKFEEIVDFAEIERFIDTPVKRYSSGMYVRLAFAVAAHLDPEILIIDEVLAVGDIQFQQKCLGKMESVSRSGRTVLFVSHNLGAVNSLTSRVVYLVEGELRACGSTSKIVQIYASAANRLSAEWSAPEVSSYPLQITAMRLAGPNGDTAIEVEVSDAFRIVIDYVVRRPISRGVVDVRIYTADGVHVMTSADSDTRPELLQSRHPGRFRSSVQIPGGWLGLGSYVIRVNSGLWEQETWDYQEAARFSVVEIRTQTVRQIRSTILSPMLAWDTVEQG